MQGEIRYNCEGCGEEGVPPMCGCGEALTPVGAADATDPDRPKRIYVASRASVPARPAMWRCYRERWRPEREIVSTWIDESGPGETASFADLWSRIVSEVLSSDLVIVYAEQDDFPLKGAYVEVGAALGAGIPVAVVLPGVMLDSSRRPIGSWVEHPLVTLYESVEAIASVTEAS